MGEVKCGADVFENANAVFIFSSTYRQSVFENEWSWQPSPTSDFSALSGLKSSLFLLTIGGCLIQERSSPPSQGKNAWM
jgi:hypothetical protein